MNLRKILNLRKMLNLRKLEFAEILAFTKTKGFWGFARRVDCGSAFYFSWANRKTLCVDLHGNKVCSRELLWNSKVWRICGTPSSIWICGNFGKILHFPTNTVALRKSWWQKDKCHKTIRNLYINVVGAQCSARERINKVIEVEGIAFETMNLRNSKTEFAEKCENA